MNRLTYHVNQFNYDQKKNYFLISSEFLKTNK